MLGESWQAPGGTGGAPPEQLTVHTRKNPFIFYLFMTPIGTGDHVHHEKIVSKKIRNIKLRNLLHLGCHLRNRPVSWISDLTPAHVMTPPELRFCIVHMLRTLDVY